MSLKVVALECANKLWEDVEKSCAEGKTPSVDVAYDVMLSKSFPQKSVVAHCAEVAACALALIDNTYLGKTSVRLANKFGYDVNEFRTFLSFVAFVHDIGKIHPTFQKNVLLNSENPEFLEILENKGYFGNDTSFGSPEVARHEKYGEEILKREFFKMPMFAVSKSAPKNPKYAALASGSAFELTATATIATQIVSMHHDRHSSISLHKESPTGSKESDALWESAQNRFLSMAIEAFPFANLNVFETNNCDIVAQFALSLVRIADVYASEFCDNKNIKNSVEVKELQSYIKEKKEEYSRKFTESGLSLQIEKLSFSELFPEIDNSRPTQIAAQRIYEEYGDDIACVIIEDVMGSGKTEAGLYLAHQLGDEFYFALPTNATASAMLGRVKNFCEKIGAGNVRMLSGTESLVTDQYSDEDGDWMLSKYYKLLEPHAVGTMDQVFKSVRRSTLSPFLFAPAISKTVIFDEVHSCDTYMTAIAKAQVELAFKVGSPVILMSATLSSKVKKDLLSNIAVNYEPIDAYPLITIVLKDGTVVQKPTDCWHNEKKVSYKVKEGMNDPEKIAVQASLLVRNGGVCGVIVNTTGVAKSVYSLLKNDPSLSDAKVVLAHSRFFEKDKSETTKELSCILGEDRSNRPNKAVVVSTQIFEQSVNIDFDYLVTQIAPVDALLQRIGRLHRYDLPGTVRDLWKGDKASLVIFVPEKFGDYKQSKSFIYKGTVLDETESLFKSMGGAIRIPSDIRLMINNVTEKAEFEDHSSEAMVGMLNISDTPGYFSTYRLPSLSKKISAVRYGGDTVRVSLVNKDDINVLVNNNFKNHNMCVNILKERTVVVPRYEVAPYYGLAVQSKGLLKNCVVVPVDEEMRIENKKVYSNELGAIFKEAVSEVERYANER